MKEKITILELRDGGILLCFLASIRTTSLICICVLLLNLKYCLACFRFGGSMYVFCREGSEQ